MPRDRDRIQRLTDALRRADLDALVCALPADVRMMSGYWPVVGTSIAVFTRDSRVSLIVPEDEKELASHGWADDVVTFQPALLDRLTNAAEAVSEPLARVCAQLKLESRRIGYEGAASAEPAPYSAVHLYGAGIIELLRAACSASPLVSATPLLDEQRSRLSPDELVTLRAACAIAQQAFVESSHSMRVGMRETEVAAMFRAPLSGKGTGFHHVERADGFCWCMSGPNSAHASAAYARSRSRQIAAGDLVLVHCNSYADGLWTDITRTYFLRDADAVPAKVSGAYRAIFDARAAALDAVRPGATGADVDRAARETLRSHGYTRQFRHATGHGVGFAAIHHDARPRIHPASADVLEPGMVFNVEPAIYEDGWGGIRHCDVVAVTAAGGEVLTPFQAGIDSLEVATA